MRRGVWVVLGLMGVAPSGALAQEAQRQPTEQTQGGSQGQGASNGGIQQQGAGQAGSASGGSDQGSALIEATGSSDSAWGGSGRRGRTSTMVTPEQAGTASPDDNSGIVIEVPASGLRIPGVVGAWRSQSLQAQPGTGGSGQSSGPSRSAWANVPNEEIFVGKVRSATRDRLLIEGPSRRVYEFGLGAKTRIVGPNGAALSLQALQEGTPVRTVTQPGEQENQVITLQVLGRAQSPSR